MAMPLVPVADHHEENIRRRGLVVPARCPGSIEYLRDRLAARLQILVPLRGLARAQPGMLEMTSALDQDALGEDRQCALARTLVSQPQPDGRVQPFVLAGIAPG